MADPGGLEEDDILFERLKEAVSEDASVRQLRRRYDTLRDDYEKLMDRLSELEDRLGQAGMASAPEPPPQLRPAGRMAPNAGGSPSRSELMDGILAPLLRLRDDYLAALAGIQNIVGGLESLAAGALKGQHSAANEPASPGSPVGRGPRDVRLEVQGSGFGELLDFQERLSAVEGVGRVSINAIDNDRATLVVELATKDEVEEPQP